MNGLRGRRKRGAATTAIHAGEGDVISTNLPLYQSNSFRFSSAREGAEAFGGARAHYIYTRWGNPTVQALEEKMAALEEAEAAIITASGMGAITGALLGATQGPAHVVSFTGIYCGTYKLLAETLPRYGVETTFIEPQRQYELDGALRKDTKILYMESPLNPSLALLDIEWLAAQAAERGLVTIVDNTFATPCCQRPLAMGVDLVVHSASKYICGHGDVIAGVVAGSGELVSAIRKRILVEFGGIVSPFNAWLLIRSLQTLPLRMDKHCENASKVARFLEDDPRVGKVNYPGLPSFPQGELARKQMDGFGGVVSFEIEGGEEAAYAFLDALELCTLATSLGDSRTLATHPATTSHHDYSEGERKKAGVTRSLVRLAVGLEDSYDLIADIDQALARACP